MSKVSVKMPISATKSKDLKIAIQLFGHLRTYRKCFPALKKHLLNKYDCDIFIHTWDTIDHSTKTWHKNKCKNAIKKVNKDEVVSLYHPKSLKIERQILEELGKITANNRQIDVFGITSMFYSMRQVNELRRQYETENSVKYDFVIFVRPDILLFQDFKIESFIKKYTASELEQIVFHAGNLTEYNFDFQWIIGEDTLFFTKPATSDNVFKKLENLTTYLKADLHIPYGPEYFLVQAQQVQQLKPVLLKYFLGQHFDIFRPFSWKRVRRQLITIRLKDKKLKMTFLSCLTGLSLKVGVSLFNFYFCFLIGKDVE